MQKRLYLYFKWRHKTVWLIFLTFKKMLQPISVYNSKVLYPLVSNYKSKTFPKSTFEYGNAKFTNFWKVRFSIRACFIYEIIDEGTDEIRWKSLILYVHRIYYRVPSLFARVYVPKKLGPANTKTHEYQNPHFRLVLVWRK